MSNIGPSQPSPVPFPSQLFPSSSLQPTGGAASTDSPGTRRKGKGKVDKCAVSVLTLIPGITRENVREWFHTATSVEIGSDMWQDIKRYIRNSQVHNYGVKVISIVKLRRWEDHNSTGYPEWNNKLRMMLWHGTKAVSLPSILQNGFQSPKANRQMFGTGIYFADRATKSANYCDSTKPGSIGYLLLCEVAIGTSYNPRLAHPEYKSPPSFTRKSGEVVPCDSVMSAGKRVPDRNKQKTLRNGCIVPYGKTIDNPKFSNCILVHNEYIVYNPKQAKIRFLVKLEYLPEHYEF